MVLVLFSHGGLRSPHAAAQDEKPRNPFGVKDIQDPDSKEVEALAAKVKLAGDDKDPNADQWVKEATEGKKGSLEGEWSDRWKGSDPKSVWQYGKGKTQIKVVGDRVYMLVESSNGKFLLDLKRDKNRLAGKYQGVDNNLDSGPCVFLVVNDERIDGNWSNAGRWDFRRMLK
jgi:hypothetical protein